jgi:hypothetical protein
MPLATLKANVAAVHAAARQPCGFTRDVAATASPWIRKNAVW